ncbi:hypothetical protein GCM10018962_51940 [Dactylosporangium matsuzakiense]|uniref:Peptidase MA-like domain-containing protein n=2 Tax=Dactylosporangium matsuzakiense TaxID=53360 RepID=A0A9W6NS75_9ACTN|nr:hypothetical protein GCM10017581_087820 [Dactylosporangium matsuzakiense]
MSGTRLIPGLVPATARPANRGPAAVYGPGMTRVRTGTVVALAAAVVAAAAVLAAQLVSLGPDSTAYAAAAFERTGPVVGPGENPLYAIQEVLKGQTAAVLHGDRDAYLGAIPVADTTLRDRAGDRFDALTALHVTRWDLATNGVPGQVNGAWRLPVSIGYCFDDPGCTPIPLLIDTEWTVVHGRVRLVGYEQTDRPWDRSRLTVRRGERVTVAGAGSVAPELLDRLLQASERGAPVDDRAASAFGGPPRRYLVYVAGDEEWKRWYVGDTENAAAYTIPLQPGTAEVVVHDRSIRADDWNLTMMTHEFAHVVTLAGNRYPAGAWWLVEGIAEYIANGDGGALHDDLDAVQRYLTDGRWDGTVALGPPAAGATLDDTVARYGIALLAVTYLAQRFGEAKLFEFFTEVVRRYGTVEAASRTILGAEWPAVAKDAAAAVRQAGRQ